MNDEILEAMEGNMVPKFLIWEDFLYLLKDQNL